MAGAGDAAALAAHRAVALHFLEKSFQGDLCGAALDAESASDVALAHLSGLFGDEGRNLFFRGQYRRFFR